MLPINFTQYPSAIPPSCDGEKCVTLGVEAYYGGVLKENRSYKFDTRDTGPLLMEQLFELNVSSPLWNYANKSIAFNWLNLTSALPGENTLHGIAMIFPDFNDPGGASPYFVSSYYGGHVGEPDSLVGSAEIEVVITLKPPSNMKAGFFMDFVSPPVYNISYPKLETSAENIRIHYLR